MKTLIKLSPFIIRLFKEQNLKGRSKRNTIVDLIKR